MQLYAPLIQDYMASSIQHIMLTRHPKSFAMNRLRLQTQRVGLVRIEKVLMCFTDTYREAISIEWM